MIEEVVLNYLTSKLEVPVYLEYPKAPKERMVIIEKTGGGSTNFIYSSPFIVQSYAESMYESAKLDETVRNVMMDIINLDEISGCSLNSSYPFNDLDNKRYRYQSIFDINYY